METLIIVIVVMLFCALLLSPFYFFSKPIHLFSKKSVSNEPVDQIPAISWQKAILFAVLGIVLIALFALYLSVRRELALPSIVDWAIFIAFAGFGGWLVPKMKNRVSGGKASEKDNRKASDLV